MKMNFLTFILSIFYLSSLAAASKPINLCSGVADGVYLPFINNCSKYYLCQAETAIERSCEVGSAFDSRQQSCVRALEAKCLPTCPENALTSFCYDRTCTKYVLCFAGTPVVRECCDGLQYNSDTDRCDFPEYVDCVDNLCASINNPDDIVFIPSHAACEKYYICVDGLPRNQTCANGLQFNKGCDCCDFPKNVNCTISALKRNIKPYSRVPPRRADIDCPTEGAHFYPHVKRADAYYYCLNGNGVTLDCTPGLVYDEKLEACREQHLIGSN